MFWHHSCKVHQSIGLKLISGEHGMWAEAPLLGNKQTKTSDAMKWGSSWIYMRKQVVYGHFRVRLCNFEGQNNIMCHEFQSNDTCCCPFSNKTQVCLPEQCPSLIMSSTSFLRTKMWNFSFEGLMTHSILNKMAAHDRRRSLRQLWHLGLIAQELKAPQ